MGRDGRGWHGRSPPALGREKIAGVTLEGECDARCDPKRSNRRLNDAFTIWFTGLSGSGKSTIGKAVGDALKARGLTVEVLDSGRIRQKLNRTLGFTREEVETNLLRLGYECTMLNRNGVVAVVTAVSPYRDVRDQLRRDIGRFVEVYCRCAMDILMQRGAKTLFEKAQRGEIQHVAGVNAP
ncbi:MAG: adenylyl-sulfate kinase, partial [Phycisphaerae bacterium]